MTGALPPPDVTVRPPDGADVPRWIARAESPAGTLADFWLTHPPRPGEALWHDNTPWTVTGVRDAETGDNSNDRAR